MVLGHCFGANIQRGISQMSIIEKPRWFRDLARFLPLKSQFILTGNVRDIQVSVTGGQLSWFRIDTLLSLELLEYGYEHVLAYNPLNGISLLASKQGEQDHKDILSQLSLAPNQQSLAFNIDELTKAMTNIVQHDGPPVALLIDFASQMVMSPENLVKAEHDAFTRALVLSQQSNTRPCGEARRPFFNTIIWIANKEGDLPDWLTIGNPSIRHIALAQPDQSARRALGDQLLKPLTNNDAEREQALQVFVDQTENLLLTDLTAIIELARAENIAASDIGDAVRRYKVGVTEDPWKKIERSRIVNGEPFIRQRVKGQGQAVTHIMDIVKRAITGIGKTRTGGRPRGVVFLAGPTGVGKTELAKTVTELLFGDESACIRFDMSEFSAEHSDQRLIGAPPGYVGYDVGGELTNAVRDKPFSVVLFDEIEKAHPRILDKFLQVLDDGVLTSGRGDRVYFSETLIVFTSNLGIYKLMPDGSRTQNVSESDSYAEVSGKVVEEIDRYFKFELNRPELLNRIGDNIVVFDFIRNDVALKIFNLMIQSDLNSIKKQQKLDVGISDKALEGLVKLCLSDLSNGGRGIRNKLELHFVNPLSRAIFDLNPAAGEKITITAIEAAESHTVLTLESN